MKLISLNTWCGLKYKQLKLFLEKHLNEVDIFCFQEVRNGEYLNCNDVTEERVYLFNDMQNILVDFRGYYTEIVPGVGLAIFVRNNIKVKKVDSVMILGEKDISHLKMSNGNSYYPRLMQSIYLSSGLIIHNFHGIPGNLKKDTPERDLQTERLIKILNSSNAQQVLVGDFNLDINTESILRLGLEMLNLIKEGEFKTTRNDNYDNYSSLPFADYAFVSRNLVVNNFNVLEDMVSDHLPLFLDFEDNV